MAIWVYSGPPGGGKTYSLVRAARRAYSRGIRIFSNQAFLLPDGTTPYKLDRAMIRRGLPPGSLAVVTEAGRMYNAREWKDFTMADFDAFTLHRHMGINMIMDVQHPSRIEITIRQIVEIIWWTRRPMLIRRPDGTGLGLPFLIQHAYLNVEDIGNDKKVWMRKIVPLERSTMKAYDTTWERSRFEQSPDDWQSWPWGGSVPLSVLSRRHQVSRIWGSTWNKLRKAK